MKLFIVGCILTLGTALGKPSHLSLAMAKEKQGKHLRSFLDTTDEDDGNTGSEVDPEPYDHKKYVNMACCGQANSITRIVGGSETFVNEYPWMAGVVRPGDTRTFCGGSVINNRYVLTAAHCVAGAEPDQVEVLLGDHRIGVADPPGEKRYSVDAVITHPRYSSFLSGYDASLLRLSRNITMSSRVRPVCLPSGSPTFAGLDATAAGFGSVGLGQPQASQLMEVNLRVWSQRSCRRVWPFLTSSMVCAGGTFFGGRSVCAGDSGGPLMYPVSGRYTLVGLTSYGLPCALPSIPDVFTRVSTLVPWLEDTTVDAALC